MTISNESIIKEVENNKYKTVFYGNCFQDIVDDKPVKKAIEWYVLEENYDKVLLMSKDIISSMYFHDYDDVNITWETSLLRMWLNRFFYEETFTEIEKDNILYIKIPNSNRNKEGYYFGNDTNDHLFILNAEELKKYFNDEKGRIARGNQYARALGLALYDTSIGNGENISDAAYYWIREAGYRKDEVRCVDNMGCINEYGYCATTRGIGVRPCMWVKKEAININN